MIRKKWAGAAIAVLFLASGCARMPAPSATPRLVPPDAGWVTRTLRKMTLEEKIGQMIAVRFTGAFRNADSEYLRGLESLITKTKIGGLILSGGEVYETAELTNAFQKLAKVPLLFASDLERGAGTQLTNATLFPPLMSLGASGSEEQAYEMGRITAVEGRAVGIHMTYAPVVDVNINPDNPIINTRSVGEDPALVSRIASGLHPRLPGERDDRHGQALSRPRRHGPGLPPPAADRSPPTSTGSKGSSWRPSGTP